MKRRLLVVGRALLAWIALAVPASALAPAGQYEPFKEADQRVQDHFTRLVWERNVTPLVPLSEAATYCVGGTRLPTVKELLTLVDETPNAEYDSTVGGVVDKMIDNAAFPHTPAAVPYWTSTPTGDGHYFTVDFKTGKTDQALPTDNRYMRCVEFVP